MNAWLWAGQIFLAVAFGATGLWKLVVPKNNLRASMPWVDDLPQGTVHAIGAAEVIGAIGVTLPWALGIAPVLSPLAAVGLALVMVGGFATHIRRHEYVRSLSNVFFLTIAVLVAVGRF
ncbi:DoxX family protein [Streptomyces sp. NPDC052042]|uniref:DoxX family protein n=1 Tax=Streptomyces sp. NPDC052042 TaxID=3365683 RepID=UPI0037D18F46